MATPKAAMIAPLNFPPGPNVGDRYTAPDGRVFEWDGSAWLIVPGVSGSLWSQAATPVGAIYYNSGNVGVGPAGNHPQFPLDVDGSINGDEIYVNGTLFATFT